MLSWRRYGSPTIAGLAPWDEDEDLLSKVLLLCKFMIYDEMELYLSLGD